MRFSKDGALFGENRQKEKPKGKAKHQQRLTESAITWNIQNLIKMREN